MKSHELVTQIRKKKSFLCVGLDIDVEKVPACLQGEKEPYLTFNREIIDATKEFTVAYKPNVAFYEAMGIQGWELLAQTISYIREHAPECFIIADAKRGDIGNTARMYAQAFFTHLNCDAITVAPYMGEDSVMPFLQTSGKWAIVLALTSNQGARDFQYLTTERDSEPLFKHVLRKVSSWGTEENIMFVIGATQSAQLEEIRQIVPRHFLLVPGIGAQGGDLQSVCRYGMNDQCGLLVNSSRGILFGDSSPKFAETARQKAYAIQQEMERELKKKGLEIPA